MTAVGPGREPEAIAANHGAVLNDYAFADLNAFADGHVRVDDAVVANLRARPDRHVRIDQCSRANAGLVSDPPPCDVGPKLLQIIQAAGDRLKVYGDILDYADFFLPDDQLPYDEQVFDKRVHHAEGAKEILAQLKQLISTTDPFDSAHLEQAIKSFAEQNNLQMAQIVHPLRVALTGKGIGFGRPAIRHVRL